MNIQRPTPETNAAACELFCRFDQGGTYNAESSVAPQGEWVPVEISCNLERQRDELAVKLVANEAYQSGILSERDEAIRDLEQGFMQGPYARLKQLQDRERDYFAMFQQLEAMREAVKEAYEALMLAPYRDQEALAKLQPLLKP